LAESTGTFSAVADDLELAMPESIVAASSLPAAVIEPIATEPRIEQELRRARSRRNQMAVAIIMFMVVLVLAGVFVWVLRRDAASMKAQETPPADVQVPEKETEKSTRINRSVQIAFAMCECEFTSLIERG
jgi:cytoskeletal protein RodZ